MRVLKKQSFLTKLLCIFLITATIPAIAIGVLSISTTYKTLWKNTVYSTEQMVDQVKKSIGSLFEDAEYFLKIGEENCLVAYLASNSDDYENAKQILNVFEIYSGNCGFDKNVNNIYAVSCDGKMISSRYGVSTIDKESFSLFPWDDLMTYSSHTMVAAGSINPSPYYDKQQFLYIAMPLVVKPLRDPFGAIIIELKNTVIDDFCNSVDIAGSGYFTVFSGTGQVIFGKTSEAVSDEDNRIFEMISETDAGSFTTEENGAETLVVHDTIPNTDWKLVGRVAAEDLMSDLNSIKKSLIVILCTIIPFGFLLYLIVTRELVRPLKKLQAVMRMVSLGNKSVRFDGKTRDEIGVVGESLNYMIDKLENMNRQDLKNQASLQKASLDLMQAQINPHFLYNTLDTIVWSANAGDNKRVIEIVDALAAFYRATLSGGESYVTVAEEVCMTENYLFIQKTRFRDSIVEHIEIADSISGQRMLKLTLQPIVENAIYHGLRSKCDNGNLWISGCEEGEYMIFEIRDDGVGITGEKLAQLKQSLNNGETNMNVHEDGGFGLENVNARIKLYYGSDCGVEINAPEEGGTVVRIRLRKSEGTA